MNHTLAGGLDAAADCGAEVGQTYKANSCAKQVQIKPETVREKLSRDLENTAEQTANIVKALATARQLGLLNQPFRDVASIIYST